MTKKTLHAEYINSAWPTRLTGYSLLNFTTDKSNGYQESIFLVEARESERELMRLTALDEFPTNLTESSATSSATLEPYLDLSVRQKLQDNRSTVTTLESLASSIEDLDKTLKRNRDIISNVDKESQVKEHRNNFKGIFPSGDCKDSSKKSRTN